MKRLFVTLFAAIATNLGASTVIMETPPGNSGPGSSSPVGYSMSGIGQSVEIVASADGLVLESFTFLAGDRIQESNAGTLYAFREEYHGLSSSLSSLSIGNNNGLIGVGSLEGSGTYSFLTDNIILSAGEKLWFYTSELTLLALAENSGYTQGDFYLPNTEEEGDVYGDALQISGHEFDLQFRVTAISADEAGINVVVLPEPSSSALFLSAFVLIGVKRRR